MNAWNDWGWVMALWMIGATMAWIALIALVAWAIARWEMRALRRVNVSAVQLQRAPDALGEVVTETYDDLPATQTSNAHA
jgi:uncharacterized membrane protein YeiB